MHEHNDKSLRVVQVFRAPLGGLFRHVLDLVRGLIERGHQVGIICDERAANAYSESMLTEIVPHLSLGLVRFRIDRNPGISDLSALRKVRAALAAQKPDIVHGHGSKGGLYARLCAPRARGAITAYTPHGGSFHYKPGTSLHSVFRRVEGFLERRTDLFLFESDFIRRRYLDYVGAPKPLVCVAHNGIHPHEFEPVLANPDAADLVYVGEFRSLKGLNVLIDALALVARRIGRPPSIVFVGSGPDENLVKKLLADRGLTHSSQFLTPRPIREAFRLGQVIVVPSLAESLPYVSLEAAGAQIPMISTNVGGIPEIFGPFSNDLIPPGNVEALAKAIETMMARSADERRARAKEISAYVRQHFNCANMVETIIAAYQKALAHRMAPAK